MAVRVHKQTPKGIGYINSREW